MAKNTHKKPGDCLHPRCHKKASPDTRKLAHRCEEHQALCPCCWENDYEKNTGYCPACWAKMLAEVPRYHRQAPPPVAYTTQDLRITEVLEEFGHEPRERW